MTGGARFRPRSTMYDTSEVLSSPPSLIMTTADDAYTSRGRRDDIWPNEDSYPTWKSYWCHAPGNRISMRIRPRKDRNSIFEAVESLVVFSLLETVRAHPMARPMSSARTKGRGERPPEPAGQSSESERRGGSCEEETREWPG